eukprot:11188137-Lingulodinium_polyedra.AAC.1
MIPCKINYTIRQSIRQSNNGPNNTTASEHLGPGCREREIMIMRPPKSTTVWAGESNGNCRNRYPTTPH